MGLKNVDISELYDLFKSRIGCYFVCCDIKNMIQINEISHKAGDLAILETMDRMNRTAGDADLVFRIGGDEFCILTDSRDQAYAEEIAEKIRSMNGEAFSFEGREIILTLYATTTSLEQKNIRYADLYRELCNAIEEEKKRSE